MTKVRFALILSLTLVGNVFAGTGGGSSGGGGIQGSGSRGFSKYTPEQVLTCMTDVEVGLFDGVQFTVFDPSSLLKACGANAALVDCTIERLQDGYPSGTAHEGCLDLVEGLSSTDL